MSNENFSQESRLGADNLLYFYDYSLDNFFVTLRELSRFNMVNDQITIILVTVSPKRKETQASKNELNGKMDLKMFFSSRPALAYVTVCQRVCMLSLERCVEEVSKWQFHFPNLSLCSCCFCWTVCSDCFFLFKFQKLKSFLKDSVHHLFLIWSWYNPSDKCNSVQGCQQSGQPDCISWPLPETCWLAVAADNFSAKSLQRVLSTPFWKSMLNPFTPESDQCQNSPAASQEIWHHTVWRTWLFIAYSDEKWLYYKFSLHHSYNRFLKGWENTLFELRSERLNGVSFVAQGLCLSNMQHNHGWYVTSVAPTGQWNCSHAHASRIRQLYDYSAL